MSRDVGCGAMTLAGRAAPFGPRDGGDGVGWGVRRVLTEREVKTQVEEERGGPEVECGL